MWLFFTLLSIGFLIAYYFFSKKFLNEDSTDPLIYAGVLQLCTGFLALPIAIFSGFTFLFTTESIILLVILAISYMIGASLYYTGLKKTDLSETTILDSSGIIWSILIGVLFLHEGFYVTKVIGAILILLAIVIVALKKERLLRFNRYEIFILLSAVFYSGAAAIDNRLIQYSNSLSYIAISFLTPGIIFALVNTFRIQKVGWSNIKKLSLLKVCMINGVFLILTYGCVFKAYELGGEVSKMYPIQQSESVLIPLIGILVFKEKSHIIQKILATIIAFAGILLIGL